MEVFQTFFLSQTTEVNADPKICKHTLEDRLQILHYYNIDFLNFIFGLELIFFFVFVSLKVLCNIVRWIP